MLKNLLTFKAVGLGEITNFIQDGFNIYDIPIFFSACFAIWILYNTLSKELETVKAKAWIIMLISSTVLSIFGTVHVLQTIVTNAWSSDKIYCENWLSRCVLLFFTASNVMDLFIGKQEYPKHLDPFSTIFHHIFYIGFMIALLSHHYSTGFLLCFFMEIPTFILAIGTVYKGFRSDMLFGISFLITRVAYNAYLAYQLYKISPSGVIWKVCVCVLVMHLYWFKKWVYVYGKSLLVSSKSSAIELPKA